MVVLRQYLFKAVILPVLFMAFTLAGNVHAKTLVGVIMTADIPYYASMHKALVENLKKNLPEEEVEFILQRPFPDPIAWSNAARKLIAIEVDLVISYGAPATQAVLFEKSGIPVVYVGVYEPEEVKISGDNVTGCGYKIPLSSLLRYFKRIKQINKLQVVYSSNEEDSVRQMTELIKLCKQQRIELSRIDIRTYDDLRKFKGIGKDDAVYITGSALAHIWIEDILSLLWKKRVPSVGIFPDPKELGMLITLYQPPEQQGEKAAEIVARVIQGSNPEDIAPEVLRTTELVFNLDEANQLGITFPMQVIVEATRVIR